MDQTPIQAEMPQETTVAATGAMDARIATGGEVMFGVSLLIQTCNIETLVYQWKSRELPVEKRRIRGIPQKITGLRTPRFLFIVSAVKISANQTRHVYKCGVVWCVVFPLTARVFCAAF